MGLRSTRSTLRVLSEVAGQRHYPLARRCEGADASTKTIGDIFVQLLFRHRGARRRLPTACLNGPTNLVWIDRGSPPAGARRRVLARRSRRSLRRQSRRRRRRQRQGRDAAGSAATITSPHSRSSVMAALSTTAASGRPGLANLVALAPNVDWMNGVQYYLSSDVPRSRPCALRRLAMGADLDLSAAVLAEVRPRSSTGTATCGASSRSTSRTGGHPVPTAERHAVLAPRRFAHETWNQLKRIVNIDEELVARRGHCIRGSSTPTSTSSALPGHLTNAEPLLVNLVGTWPLRPMPPPHSEPVPASDYVRTYTDLATMEGANEAARRAVNGLLDAVGYDGSRCEVWPLHEPEVLAPWRLHDAARFERGLPWDDSLLQVAAHAIRGAVTVPRASPSAARAGRALRDSRRRPARADGRRARGHRRGAHRRPEG